ncbi:MAG: OmpH family outer membrane protein [Gammaproteobacteria bacterium]
MTTRKHIPLAMISMAALMLFTGIARAELKVGFVDLAKLSENAPQIISAQGKIDAEFSSREKELVALQRKIAKMEEELSNNGAVMSESERGGKEREILSKRRELKRSQDEFRDDLNIRKNEILKQVNIEIGNVIEALAKDEKYDLIIAQGVMFASDRVDITETILKKLSSGK